MADFDYICLTKFEQYSMSKYLVAFSRQNLKTSMKEDFYFVLTAKSLNEKQAKSQFEKLYQADKNYSTPKFLYFRKFFKTLYVPTLLTWAPSIRVKKNVKYYLVTWMRMAFSKDHKKGVHEYFHLIVPSSKANPNDGTAEFNRLQYRDIGYVTSEKNTEVESYDRKFYKYWHCEKFDVGYSSVFYELGVELKNDFSNLPDIMNHWYEVADETTLYKQWGFTDEDVKGFSKENIKTIMQFVKADWSHQQAVEWIRKSIAEEPARKKREEEQKNFFKNLKPETKKMVSEIFKNALKKIK